MKKQKDETTEFKTFTQIPQIGVPYKCPVCGGRGFVSSGFYQSVGTDSYLSAGEIEICRSCSGSGIVIC